MDNLIQWPRAQYWDKAWNPIIGCKPCSPACEHCYAKAMTERFRILRTGEIRTAAFRRIWIALRSSLREAKVEAKGADAMPNTTLITLPCTAQELENALHSLCDHSGIWDATVDVRLRNVNALTISCNQTEGTNNGK